MRSDKKSRVTNVLSSNDRGARRDLRREAERMREKSVVYQYNGELMSPESASYAYRLHHAYIKNCKEGYRERGRAPKRKKGIDEFCMCLALQSPDLTAKQALRALEKSYSSRDQAWRSTDGRWTVWYELLNDKVAQYDADESKETRISRRTFEEEYWNKTSN